MTGATVAGRFDLGGRVVVITGASKGIGRELTILLANSSRRRADGTHGR